MSAVALSLGNYSPSFLNRFFTSLKWNSREQSFSSSPFLKCFATSGSAAKLIQEIGVVAAGVFDFPGFHGVALDEFVGLLRGSDLS